jgi:hypothetical protein
MHTLTQIYDALVQLGTDKAGFVSTTTTYLGAVGTYSPPPSDPGCVTNPVTGFASGDGSVDDPYQICNWIQLNNVRNHLVSSYILTDNLDENSVDYVALGDAWLPIGNCGPDNDCWDSSEDNIPFTGTFNGDNYTISDLVVNRPGVNGAGLFGLSSGNISDLNLNLSGLSGSTNSGGLVGTNYGTVDSCSVTVSGTIGVTCVAGGLVGWNFSSGVINSSSATVLSSGQIDSMSCQAGGLVGWNDGSVSSSNSIVYDSARVSAPILQEEFGSNDVGITLGNNYYGGNTSDLSGRITDRDNGRIDFNQNISDPKGGNLTDYIYIDNNLAVIDATLRPGYDKPANITLLNTGITGGLVLKDGVACGVSCSGLSSNGTDYTFSVTGAGQYSIGSGD